MPHTPKMSIDGSDTQFTVGTRTFTPLGVLCRRFYSTLMKVRDESTQDILVLKVMRDPVPAEAQRDARRETDFLKSHRHVKASTHHIYYIALTFTAPSYSTAPRVPS